MAVAQLPEREVRIGREAVVGGLLDEFERDGSLAHRLPDDLERDAAGFQALHDTDPPDVPDADVARGTARQDPEIDEPRDVGRVRTGARGEVLVRLVGHPDRIIASTPGAVADTMSRDASPLASTITRRTST